MPREKLRPDELSTGKSLRDRLVRLEPAALADLLVQLAKDDEAVRERVEALAMRGDGVGAALALRQRLERIAEEDSFISYRESEGFARRLEAWLSDLETGLLPIDPEAAWSLVEELIRMDGPVMERVDDWDPSIVDVFRRACGFWHRAAAVCRGPRDLAGRVYDLHAECDHGTRDALLDESATSLSEPELRALADRYQSDALRETGHDTPRFRVAAAAMELVACALRDASLYERAVRLRSSQPDTAQAKDIAEQYLRFGPVERAVEWLTGIPEAERCSSRALHLLALAHEKLGDREALIEVRRHLAENSLSAETHHEYVALLAPADREAAHRRAVQRAVSSGEVVEAALFLLAIGKSEEAAARVVEHLVQKGWPSLLELAESLEEAESELAAALCYRALVAQILDVGRSKAYHHAKDYVDRLDALDAGIDSYGRLPDHARYMAALRDANRRKHGFWRRFE